MLRMTAFGLLLLTFFGSVGVVFYSHTCAREQVTINTFFAASGHCEADHREQKVESCCGGQTQNGQAAKNENCCSESIGVVYLSFRFFEQIPAFQFVLPDTAIEWKKFEVPVSECPREMYALASDPDPPAGREILTRICIWRL